MTTTTKPTPTTPDPSGHAAGSSGRRRPFRRAATAAALVALATACGTTGADSVTPDPVRRPAASADVRPTTVPTSTPAERPTGTVDRLVAIPGGRMHLRCAGSGATTVLLVAGWDGGDGTWGGIEPSLTQHARVCSTARFGTGSSDPATTPRTFTDAARDLHALLVAAGEPGPYVVLGHSFGGAIAVTFASAYPAGVEGLLLLDASPTGWPDMVCGVPAYRAACELMRDPAADAERLDVFPAFEQVARITSLGDLPLTVMTGAHRDPTGLSAPEVERLDAAWAAGQERWAGLSSASTVVTVERTGHHIEVDQPARVVDELEALLAPGRSNP